MVVNPRLLLPRLRQLAAENKLFSWALAAGALLRLITILGYPGALFFYGDSYVYLGAALRPQPNLSKVTGYSFFLRALLPFHSLTLVVTLQHLMGLAVAVMIYVLLRRNGVSKLWSTVATLPQLLDGYIIEDEHLIMTETLFTFLLMIAMLIVLWKPRPAWWSLLIAGVLAGCASLVRTDGEVVLAVIPLFLLIRGWSWKTVRGWLMAITFAVGSLLPIASYEGWFHDYYPQPQYHAYETSLAQGFFLWGRVSSFVNCAVIKPTGEDAIICPTDAIVDRTPPGNYVWENPYIHSSKLNPGFSPVTIASNKLLTDFAIKAIEDQPLGYVKTVVKDVGLSFGFPRIAYPGPGTTYYYSFHLHYVVAPSATSKGYSTLPPKTKTWIGTNVRTENAYSDWLAYGHQTPGVVNTVFAAPILVYERVVFTWGPLLAVIFLLGLGGLISVTAAGWRREQGLRAALSFRTLRSVRLHWSPRGTSMLPWITAVVLLVVPIMVADFDYRYLIPVIPFACMAAGLGFAPRRAKPDPAAPSAPSTATVESTVPDSVS
jgi:Dolichyl-phosphate-mannose-protein mannosyltransferase